MKTSQCICGARAEYSVCVLVSTLGVRPRHQKCGRAQLFCASCMQQLLAKQWNHGASGMKESLSSAYTELPVIPEPFASSICE